MLDVALVEDSETMRMLLVECLGEIPNLVISRQIDEREGALAALLEASADVVIADINLRGGDSLAMVRELKLRVPRTRIFVFSGTTNEAVLREFERAGVDAIFRKPDGLDALCNTLASLAGAAQ